MGVLIPALYGGLTLLNYVNSRKKAKKFSGGEKVAIGASTLLGLDSIIAKDLTGSTLTELMGLSVGPAAPLFTFGKRMAAWAGNLYHTYKNYKYGKQEEKS